MLRRIKVVRVILKLGFISVPVGSIVVVVDFFMQCAMKPASVESVQREANVAKLTYISEFICETKKKSLARCSLESKNSS